MKLARIDHDRCDEYAGTILIWIPDDMTEKKFLNAVERAQTAYLTYLKEFREANPPPGPFFHNFGYTIEAKPDEYPDDLTLGEAKEKFQSLRKNYKDWETKRDKSKQGVRPFLEAEGFVPFWLGLEDALEFEAAEMYWGHRHGESIDYDETDVDDTFPPLKGDEWA